MQVWLCVLLTLNGQRTARVGFSGHTGLAAPDLRSPEQSESFALPSYDGCRFDDAPSRAPFGAGSTKPSPQEPVEPVQFRLLDRTLQHAKLVAEDQDLKLQRRSSAEDRQRGGEQCRYHGGQRELTESAQPHCIRQI